MSPFTRIEQYRVFMAVVGLVMDFPVGNCYAPSGMGQAGMKWAGIGRM